MNRQDKRSGKSPLNKALRSMTYDQAISINEKLVFTIAAKEKENKELYDLLQFYKQERNKLIEVRIARAWHTVKMKVLNPIISYCEKREDNKFCSWILSKIVE